MRDAIDLGDFEAAAIALKEDETDLFRTKTLLAHWAMTSGAQRYLAHLWGTSAQAINTLARIFEAFVDDEITPDVPLSLWNAVMETGDPRAWLARALAEGLSARGVRDAADILKGKHYSSAVFRGRVQVTEWDVLAGRLAVEGMRLSGEKPEMAEVTVREVLQG